MVRRLGFHSEIVAMDKNGNCGKCGEPLNMVVRRGGVDRWTSMDLQQAAGIAAARSYDVQDWWPADSPFEVMVGAILTQQTTWESVAKVLDRLREEVCWRSTAWLPASCTPGIDPQSGGFLPAEGQEDQDLAAYISWTCTASDPLSLLRRTDRFGPEESSCRWKA